MSKKFGNLIQQLRKNKGCTVKELIEKLDGQVSPAYMTKVEVYGEIPSPELICKIADILGHDQKNLLSIAIVNYFATHKRSAKFRTKGSDYKVY